jgi:AcrR family transcriptional regulator
MHLFRAHGHDGASLDALTAAMGLSPSSLYSAFGDKERLFRNALDRYAAGPGAYDVSLRTLSGRAAIAAYLDGAARAMTRPGEPPGCLIAAGGLEGAPASTAARAAIAGHRRRRHDALLACLRAAALPPGLDAEGLAALVAAVVQGMAVQARDGAPTTALLALAGTVLRLWPAAEPVAPVVAQPVATEPVPAPPASVAPPNVTLPSDDQRNARIRRLMI